MATYLVLNAVVLAAVGLLLAMGRVALPLRPMLAILVIMLVLTAVFDTVMIQLGFFAYNPDKILRLYIGKAPIEDFAYTIAAATLVPYLWQRLGRKK